MGQTRDFKKVSEEKHSPLDDKTVNSFTQKSLYDRMVGKANESNIFINGVKCKALIDSGCMISTILVRC